MNSKNIDSPRTGPRRVLLPDDRRARQGAWLLVLSLGIFFAASLILYGIYIYTRLGDGAPFVFPRSFILSTVLLLGISLAMHLAVNAAATDQPARLKQVIAAGLFLAVGFFVVQSDGIYRLVDAFQKAESSRIDAHRLTFFLVVVHALHVVGGLVGLVWVYINVLRQRYDHERFGGVYFCAIYWHFLDIVWVFLMAGFWAASALLNRN